MYLELYIVLASARGFARMDFLHIPLSYVLTVYDLNPNPDFDTDPQQFIYRSISSNTNERDQARLVSIYLRRLPHRAVLLNYQNLSNSHTDVILSNESKTLITSQKTASVPVDENYEASSNSIIPQCPKAKIFKHSQQNQFLSKGQPTTTEATAVEGKRSPSDDQELDVVAKD
ncbi:hypothetical protein EVAR_54414_1 [Eumeta japonica]|uniref:Uncharacterized protein n=1 Tax=Eumeta variegata TaxID=151549 RepID=A0A4C1Y648_EUMVA|nr:hypothetical protein EVAR_54414_1 [Eumeta japonica]